MVRKPGEIMSPKQYKRWLKQLKSAPDRESTLSAIADWFDAGGDAAESVGDDTIFCLLLNLGDEPLIDRALETLNFSDGFRSRLAIGEAIHAKNRDVLSRLLDLGASPDPPKGALSHLAAAADNNLPECVDLLLEHGASIERRGPFGHTPLQWLARTGSEHGVQHLLDRGADSNAVTKDDGEPLTALQVARKHGNEAAARLLLALSKGTKSERAEDDSWLESEMDPIKSGEAAGDSDHVPASSEQSVEDTAKPDTNSSDLIVPLLIFGSLVMIIGGAFLADAFPQYARFIIPAIIFVPLFASGYFWKMYSVGWIGAIGLIMAAFNFITGEWTATLGGITVLTMMGIAFLGALLGGLRKASKNDAKSNVDSIAIEYSSDEQPGGDGSNIIVPDDISDAEKQFAVGIKCFNGDDVPQDDSEAARWFRKAAEQGHVEAQFFLATACHGGKGVPRDIDEAYRWYLKAAENGHISAQRTVGVALLNGDALPRDVSAAIRWLKLSAKQGDAGAQYNLGVCYYNGDGVGQNDRRAIELLKRAAAGGHERAAQVLSQLGG